MATEHYLPKNVRVCLAGPNRPAAWFTTTKETVFATEPTPTKCPITGRNVLAYADNGYTVYFVPSAAHIRVVPDSAPSEAAGIVAGLRPTLLIYDIPDRANFPNPSGEFWGVGVRVNLSCWVVPERDIPYALLHRMKAAGCTWHVIRFDPAESMKLVNMATAAIRGEIADALKRAERSVENADRILTDAESSLTDDVRHAKFVDRAESVTARLGEHLDALNAIRERFGITAGAVDASRAVNALAGMSSSFAARAETWMAAARRARELNTAAGTAMARAIESDAVPPEVVSDYLRDHGDDAGADAVFSLVGDASA